MAATGVEIEAKFRLADPAGMRRRLAEAGAVPGRRVLEENTYFDDAEESLRRGDCGLRVRVERAEGADGGEGVAILTYKGPRRPGELKIRPEHEVRVHSAEAMAEILAALGFERVLSFQKRREYYELAGAEVCLDELPELGWFVEIEAPDQQAVRRLRQRLGLGETPTIRETYIAMVARHLEGTTTRRLAFS